MPAERFYTKESLYSGQTITLENDEFHHLSHVFRIKAGEVISLVNGKGALALGSVANINKHHATISIDSVEEYELPKLEIILAQAFPRQPRLEYIVEKSVELGATKIWLFPGDFSEKKDISASGQERIQHILISSLKQCGRLFLPELVIQPKLSFWKKDQLPTLSFFGDIRPSSPHFLTLLLQKKSSPLLIAIGPEKGFHHKEVHYMEQTLAMQGVHLHDNILRTDTAAIASLALASACLQ